MGEMVSHLWLGKVTKVKGWNEEFLSSCSFPLKPKRLVWNWQENAHNARGTFFFEENIPNSRASDFTRADGSLWGRHHGQKMGGAKARALARPQVSFLKTAS